MAQGQSNFGDMLRDGLGWHYTGSYIDGFCRIVGSKELNGKTYGSLILYTPAEWDGAREMRMPREASPSYPTIGIRDEGGRILVDKAEYLSLFDQILEYDEWRLLIQKDSLPYETTADGELVIYDFTKKVGEEYCKLPDGTILTVTKTSVLHTEDGLSRRRLTLSNGDDLIEGIGCVNSSGLLLFWLCPQPSFKRRVQLDYFCYIEDNHYIDIYCRDRHAIYSPNKLLTQGRRWEYAYDNGEMKGTLSYTIAGDTLIHAFEGVKVYMDLKDNQTNRVVRQGYVGAFIQKENSIYLELPGAKEGIELYRFYPSLDRMFHVNYGGIPRFIINSDMVTVDEVSAKRMMMVDCDSDGNVISDLDSAYYWVDGIGSSRGLLEDYAGTLKDSIKFVTCCDGENRLFSIEEFSRNIGLPSSFEVSYVVDTIEYRMNKSTLTARIPNGGGLGNRGDVVMPYSIDLWGDKYIITEIEDEAFSWVPYLGPRSVVISNGVRKIGQSIFKGSHNVKSVVFPDGVQEIGPSAFLNCTNLESVVLPSGLKKIENTFFASCESLKSVKLPDSLEVIDYSTFFKCSSLSRIDLPATVVSIGVKAFAHLPNLTDLYCRAVNVPQTQYYTFYNINPEATLHVPAQSLEDYKKNWTVFKYIVPIDDTESIVTPEAKNNTPSLFDLQGRRIQGVPKHGVYIQNGKKLIIRNGAGGVTIQKDFECERGSILEIK